MKTEEFLQFLRHYRHDWLNHMQILKAYLAMDKIEDAQRYMDQIIIGTQNESMLCQLGDPELAYYLLTYNWHENRPLILELEIIQDQDLVPKLSIKQQYPFLYTWIRAITETVQQKADQYEENHLYYIFDIQNKALTLRIEFEGVWDDIAGKEAFHQLEEKIRQDRGNLTIEYCSSSEFTLELIPAETSEQ